MTPARRLPATWLLIWSAGAAYWATASIAHELPLVLRTPWEAPLLGRDAFGRPLLPLVLQASAFSGAFAAAATAGALALGVFCGSGLALVPSAVRSPLLRVLDFFLAFPSLLIAFALAAVLGPGWTALVSALCLGTLPPFIRLTYLRASEVMSQEYVLAAKALGGSSPHLLVRHVAPAVLELCRIKVPNLFAHALLAEASLSFLGVGAPVGRNTLGTLLIQGKSYLLEAPHVAFCAGVPLFLTVLSLQRLSEVAPKNWRPPAFGSRQKAPKNRRARIPRSR